MSITSDMTVVVSKVQVSCDLGGEASILNLNSSVYYGLDAVGARVWNLIQVPVKVATIRDTLLQEYDVERETCERDLLDLLGQLAAAELIEVEDLRQG